MRSFVRSLSRVRPTVGPAFRAVVHAPRRSGFSTAAATATATAQTKTASVNHDGSSRRKGDTYVLTSDEIASYHRDGYLLAPGIVSEEELRAIESVYAMFLDRQIHVPLKDFCDMSKPLSTPWEQYSLVNAMLPRRYYPPLRDNIYERRSKSIADQLFGSDAHMTLDYDQLLAKKPNKPDAVFAWHCDLAYWPTTTDTRTATFSLAVDPSTVENGCLRVVPGSHLETKLRHHYPLGNATTRDESHTLVTDVDTSKEPVHVLPVPRGGFTIHNERIVHASAGNKSSGWRRTYVIAYRSKQTVDWERAHGFTHSHNDSFNWDQFHSWQSKPKPK